MAALVKAIQARRASKRTQPYRNMARKPLGGADNVPRPPVPQVGPHGPALNAMLAGRPMGLPNPMDVRRRTQRMAR
jgi:hypothetical protein